MKENLFSSWFNSRPHGRLRAVLGFARYKLGRFVFVDARWEIIEVNLTNLLVFRFPREELWRLWVALYLLAASVGLAAGIAARGRRVAGRRRSSGPRSPLATLRRLGPLIAVVVVFLWFAKSAAGTLLVAGAAATWMVAPPPLVSRLRSSGAGRPPAPDRRGALVRHRRGLRWRRAGGRGAACS